MKPFLVKFLFFSVTCFVLLNLVARVTNSMSRSPVEDVGGEIYDAIKRAHLYSPATSLVIGDSVSHQLLTGSAPPEMLSLGTNQAISLCGQYLLARSALEHHPEIRLVTLAFQPVVFGNDLTQNYTFDYFVRPFYPYAEFRAGLDPLVMQRIDRKPLARLVVFPLFRYTTLLSYIDYSQGTSPPTYTYLSPVSIDYLRKLSVLCEAHHVPLRIISTPISRDRNYDRTMFSKEVADAHLESLFTGYAETIRLVDPAQLRDGVHFKPENVSANSAVFLEMLKSR